MFYGYLMLKARDLPAANQNVIRLVREHNPVAMSVARRTVHLCVVELQRDGRGVPTLAQEARVVAGIAVPAGGGRRVAGLLDFSSSTNLYSFLRLS